MQDNTCKYQGFFRVSIMVDIQQHDRSGLYLRSNSSADIYNYLYVSI